VNSNELLQSQTKSYDKKANSRNLLVFHDIFIDVDSATLNPTIKITPNPTKIERAQPTENPTNQPTDIPTTKSFQPTFNPIVIPSTFGPFVIPTDVTSPNDYVSAKSNLPTFSGITKETESPTFYSNPSSSPTTALTYSSTESPIFYSNPSSSPTTALSHSPTQKPGTISPFAIPPYVTSNTDDWFEYNPNSMKGPLHWDKVDASDSLYADFVRRDHNQCDGGRQSPIKISTDNENCPDDHWVGTSRGFQDFEDLEFQILPSVLRVVLDFESKKLTPRADWSNLTPAVEAKFVNVKIPSGTKYFIYFLNYVF